MPHAYSVAVRVHVGAGSRYETESEAGVSHFVEHMCFKGSQKRPTAKLISEAIESVGGTIDATTGHEFTVFSARVARPHLALALDVLVDLIRTPVCDPEEIEKERKVVLEEIAAVVDSPGEQADLLVDELQWPDQPLGRDIAGSEQTVQALTRDMTLGYMARQYVPNNIVISVAGNVEHDAVVASVEALFAGAKQGQPGRWFPAQDGQQAPRCRVLFKRTEQTHIAMALPGVPLTDPDRYALDLLGSLFGRGMSSRLFLELRERQGLCYDVSSQATHFLDAGSFGLYAAVDPSKGRVAVAALVEQLAKLRDGVTEEELGRTKAMIKGGMLLGLESTGAVAGWLGHDEILLNKFIGPESVIERIDAVTTADIARMVERVLRTSQLNLAVVGPYRSERAFLSLLDL